jgi:hypothetical protein
MKITTLALIVTATVAATIALPATAQADPSYQFQSPSGNIFCLMGDGNDVVCDIADHTYVPPPKPSDCQQGWGGRFSLDQGSAPVSHCHGDTIIPSHTSPGNIPGEPTLEYGRTQTLGAITCDSEPTGMTCTDSRTGHYFRLSRESYELG